MQQQMKQFLTIVETATELEEEQGRKMEMDEQNHGHQAAAANVDPVSLETLESSRTYLQIE